MDPVTLERRLDEIDRKLALLVDVAQVAERQQREMRELKDDLGRIATDVYQSAVTELEDVAPHFETRDLAHALPSPFGQIGG